MLGVIARELGQLPNSVVIEGHTDSRPYATTDVYSNWELSADRANAARRVMERKGCTPPSPQRARLRRPSARACPTTHSIRAIAACR